MSILPQGVAPLPQLGIIRVEGPDAASFLQGQLTQDFALMGMSQGRLAAYCSAKGRMLASFVGLKRSETEILLVCSRDILGPTLKRLSMFVLRAKVKLADAAADYSVFGVMGLAVDALGGSSVPPLTKSDVGTASLVELHRADGNRRALWIAPVASPAPAGQMLDSGIWDWAEVRSGVARIQSPVVEAFVPQMLNYESVDGVSFKKGCYPGQEIVARSQFRGTLKRRAYIVHCEEPLEVGHEVFHDADPEQPCGLIAQTATAPGGGSDAIISIQTSAAGDRLHARRPDGPVLQIQPLPYLLLADV